MKMHKVRYGLWVGRCANGEVRMLRFSRDDFYRRPDTEGAYPPVQGYGGPGLEVMDLRFTQEEWGKVMQGARIA